MESKPSRIPRRLSVQPSGSRSARIGAGSGGTSLTDSYRTRESSVRLDSGRQESGRLHSSNRNWSVEEREAYESSWKLPASSPTHYSGTLDRPWSGRFLGSRNRLVTSSSSSSLPAPSWLSESERTQGAYSSRLHSQQQDIDSKRPKLSYTSTSSMRSSGLSTVSDLQERPASSYAQGARPKENSLSSLRLNTSMNRQLPSEHESSFLSREHSWNSRSNYVPREVETSERNIQPEFTQDTMRSGTRTSNLSEGVLPTQRSLSEPSADTEGRRSTRQLLSRLASSMSSTFFPRRSGQDTLSSSRSLGSRDISALRAQAPAQATSSNPLTTSEGTEAQTPDPGPQGFSFLRRRWGLAGISPNPSAETEPGNYRHNSESRNAGSWLSSSLRNRCTPLFSRRRREGRDETARTSASETSARSLHLFRRRESAGDGPLETQRESLRPRPSIPAVPSGTVSVPSGSESVPPRRNSGISGMFPGSLFRFAMPPTLENNLSDNVMITVDIIPSNWSQSNGQDSDKSKISSRDPEKLQKIKESLLSEEEEEEEEDICRICQMSSTSVTNLLIEPCKCAGSLQYVHQECMKKWLQSKINSGSSLEDVTTCELCKEKLQLNLDNFDIHELHRAHANEQADYEFISSGLYLVVLLHLCEQRFSDMLGTTSEANTRIRQLQMMMILKMVISIGPLMLHRWSERAECSADTSITSAHLFSKPC
ncbi:E3 ubiquitin-protein ligase MARCH7 isoform X5 [Thamnophis elegans]|uniref:E3 ubiquitin-protein ligase MARCH7 isoform X5 n=1 Tax=Thamnophis elegans TaxID=35005 RepID=UPI001378121E|nr:E3 ubiquitin-protein ligase MARCH7 isoform X5 [Thamnophis elegans]